jgi:hypothetical protein
MGLGKNVGLGLTLAGTALSVAAPGFVAQADVPGHQPCPRKGAEVIASDKLVRVYVYPRTKLPSPLPRSIAQTKVRPSPPHRTEACLVRSGTRMTLFDPGQPSGSRGSSRGFTGVQAIAGTLVAYAIERQGTDSADSTVFIADIAARRVLRELPVSSSPYAKVSTRTAMTAFVLAPSGSAAWIDEKTAWTSFRRPDTKTFVVNAAPSGGLEVVLDESPGIGATSLSLTSGTLTWWDAGVERSARLP